MKRNIWMAAFAVAALSSCSQNEAIESIAQDNNAINFSTYVGRNSRAGIMYEEGLKMEKTGFRVLGYSTDTISWENMVDVNKELNFMLGDSVLWNSGSSKWEYANQKYWPNAVVDGTTLGKVSFFAYAPENDSIAVTKTLNATGDPIITYTCPASQASQVDLVTASAIDQTKNNVDGKVNFTFDHALSKIAFTAAKAANYDNAKIILKKLDVAYGTGITKKNTFNISTETWGSTGATAYVSTDTTNIYNEAIGDTLTWNTIDSQATIFKFSPESLVAGAVQKSTNYLMLIPQVITAGALKATLTYEVYDTTRLSTVTNMVTVDLPAITWEKGKQYTYNLIVTLTGVTFDVTSISGWSDGTQPTDSAI